MLDVERKNGEILISSEGSRAKFASIKPGDYPVPASPAARVSGDLDGDILIKELMEVLPYAATEESRPVLASVNMRLDVDKSALATADGFRLAVMPVPFKFPWKEEVNILPGTVAILAHLWKLAPSHPAPSEDILSAVMGKRNITFSISEKNEFIFFRFGKISVISKPVIGNFPEYSQLIPTPKNKITFMAPIGRAVSQVARVAAASSDIVRLEWTETQMTVSASAEDAGKIEALLQINGPDGPGRIAIKGSYLSDYLAGKEGIVMMGTSSTARPPS